jgi:hypothetical protein
VSDRRATYMVLDLARWTVMARYVDYDASVLFVATREAGLSPRRGFATSANKLRSLVEI